MDNNNSGKKLDIIDEILDWLETLVLYCFIALLLFSFVFKLVIVDGDSMLPTLENGQRLIVSNLFYTPKNGDIIIFNNENPRLNKTLVKRVIATEGQTISIDFNNGIVKVDGEVIDEPYIKDATKVPENFDTFYTKNSDGSVTVPEGYVFVMGDNRMNSTDSRSSAVGFVSVDSIIGRTIFRLYPFTRFK